MKSTFKREMPLYPSPMNQDSVQPVAAAKYVDMILLDHVIPAAYGIRPGFLFMQDNAKPHTAAIAMELIKNVSQQYLFKEENYNRLKEEEDKRKLVAASFTEKLNTLTTLMDESADKSLRLREENLNMTSKLSELYTRFQEREAHLTNVNNQLDLQRKLSEAQLMKQEVGFEAERLLWHNDKIALIDQLKKSEETNRVLQENTKTLQEHLNTYQKQYNDFETTMKRSSEVFDTFKAEIAKMHKSNAALEKDRNEWHSRWHSATQTIIHLTELHQQAVAEQKAFERKVKMLEKLCRKLNLERSSYIVQLKENNIEPVTPKEDEEELTMKEKQIIALKGELKAIEEQLNNKPPAKTDGDGEEKVMMDEYQMANALQGISTDCAQGQSVSPMRTQVASSMQAQSVSSKDTEMTSSTSTCVAPSTSTEVASSMSTELASSMSTELASFVDSRVMMDEYQMAYALQAASSMQAQSVSSKDTEMTSSTSTCTAPSMSTELASLVNSRGSATPFDESPETHESLYSSERSLTVRRVDAVTTDLQELDMDSETKRFLAHLFGDDETP